MRYPTYVQNGVCSKCAFPFAQIFKQFFDSEHDMIEDREVKKCKIKGEHLHMECICGYTFVLRPLDWDDRMADKKRVETKSKTEEGKNE